MATPTYEPIESKTLGSATNNVTFSSIPQTYRDLVLIVNGRKDTSVSVDAFFCRINSDGGNNYSWTQLAGNGSSIYSDRVTNDSYCRLAIVPGNNAGSTTFGTAIVNFQNYSNTTTNKTMISRGSVVAGEVTASVSLWRNTNAITSFTLYTAGLGNWAVGSTFTLYGISNVGDESPKASGGEVYSDSSYWYHVFTMSGDFVPNQSLTADLLLVGGGGSGSWHGPGVPYADTAGGGAGGLRVLNSQSLTVQNYVAQVGAGGAGNGISGGASLFGTISAAGGGGGGIWVGGAGSAGGSGGGGCGSYSGIGTRAGGAGNTPSTSPSQGNNGGNGIDSGSGTPAGGGGGGAGGAGNNASGGVGGNGGIGYYDTFTNTIGALAGVGQLSSGNYYFAGGGGGATRGSTQGTGGLGGGTAGAGLDNSYGRSANALVNSGGGSGGGSYVGNGGSGLIVVRYAK
jgi:hypothetical protein